MKITQSIFKTLLIIGITLFPIINCFAQNFNEIIKATASNRAESDFFGHSVAISGNYAIVGAYQEDEDANDANTLTNSGSAYIYELDVSGQWNEIQKIVASERADSDQFGRCVAISGNYAIISCHLDDEDANGTNYLDDAGSAYIFERDVSGVWNEVQKIVASDRGASDVFGLSLSISGDYAIIGVYADDEDVAGANFMTTSGSAYIFERNGSGVWNEVQKIVASDRTAYDNFGKSVSISGDYAIVGAHFEDHDANGANSILSAGSAYIFERNGSGIWGEVQKIVASDRNNSDYFGESVSISGNYAIVGAVNNAQDANGTNFIDNAGSAFIFERDVAGVWNEVQKITASIRADSDQFGNSVSISGNKAIIGSWLNDNTDATTIVDGGGAYVFQRNDSGLWYEVQKIKASDRSIGDRFGKSVSISGNYTIVGAYAEDEDASGTNTIINAGSMYIFKSTGIYGLIYNDINNNCIVENEVGIPGRLAIITPGDIVVQTGNAGYWFIDSLPIGTYTITIDTSGTWNPTCSPVQTFNVIDPESTMQAPSFGLISTSPCAEPNVSINMPFLRPGFSNQKIYVHTCNQYNASGILNNAYVIVELDSLLTVDNASISYIDLGNNNFQFDLGTLNPGECASFDIFTTLSTSATLGQSLCMSANLFPTDDCVFDSIPANDPPDFTPCPLPWDNSSISVEGWCENDSIFFTITNTGDFGNGDMDCLSPIRLFIDGEYIYLDSIQLLGGVTDTLVFAGDGRTWRLEVDQHPLHPGNSNPNATVELCGNADNWTSDLVNILPHDDADPVVDIYCGVVTGSYDPNDKTGFPLGVTDSHFVAPNQALEYMIRFQNTGTDTAFTVVIRDTLDADFDIFSVHSGVASHDYKFRMYGSRILEWTFDNILLPDSSTNQIESNGFISFKVSQINNLIDGTELNNLVGIYFDFNPPIITNETSHIIKRNIKAKTWTEEKSITVNECNEYIHNGINYSNTGTYYQIVEGASTDTLLTLNLTINTVNSSVSQIDDLLTAIETGAAYQWIECPEMTPIDGATSQSYSAELIGDYALIISNNGCTDTSVCYTVVGVGIIENDFGEELQLYPNPTKGDFSIDLGENYNSLKITMSDLNGKLVLSNTYNDTQILNLKIDEPAGTYILVIETNDKKAQIKLIKE